MAKRLRGRSVEVFSAKARVSCALDAACGLSHLHNMTPRQGGNFEFQDFRMVGSRGFMGSRKGDVHLKC